MKTNEDSKRIRLGQFKTPNSSFTVYKATQENRPTMKMSLEEIQVLLDCDASARKREEVLERTKHTRPTVQFAAVKV